MFSTSREVSATEGFFPVSCLTSWARQGSAGAIVMIGTGMVRVKPLQWERACRQIWREYHYMHMHINNSAVFSSFFLFTDAALQLIWGMWWLAQGALLAIGHPGLVITVANPTLTNGEKRRCLQSQIFLDMKVDSYYCTYNRVIWLRSVDFKASMSILFRLFEARSLEEQWEDRLQLSNWINYKLATHHASSVNTTFWFKSQSLSKQLSKVNGCIVVDKTNPGCYKRHKCEWCYPLWVPEHYRNDSRRGFSSTNWEIPLSMPLSKIGNTFWKNRNLFVGTSVFSGSILPKRRGTEVDSKSLRVQTKTVNADSWQLLWFKNFREHLTFVNIVSAH